MQDNEPYIIRKKHEKQLVIFRGRIVFALFLAAVAVAVVVIMLSLRTGITKNESVFGFVVMGEYLSSSESESAAQSVTEAGGAGYVINNGKFLVCAAAYRSSADARTVSERLNADGGSTSVHILELPAVSITASRDKILAAAIAAALDAPIIAFDALQNTLAELDKGEISEALALYRVMKVSSDMQKTADALPLSGESAPLKSLLGVLCESLSTCAASVSSPSVSSRLRYALCDVAVKTVECFSSLAA